MTKSLKYSSVLSICLMCWGDTVGRKERSEVEYKLATVAASLV